MPSFSGCREVEGKGIPCGCADAQKLEEALAAIAAMEEEEAAKEIASVPPTPPQKKKANTPSEDMQRERPLQVDDEFEVEVDSPPAAAADLSSRARDAPIVSCNGTDECRCVRPRQKLDDAVGVRRKGQPPMPTNPAARAKAYPEDGGIVHYDRDIGWVCSSSDCRHTIAEHPAAQSQDPDPTNRRDVKRMLVEFHTQRTERVSSCVLPGIQLDQCDVCGATEALSRAHILRHAKSAESVRKAFESGPGQGAPVPTPHDVENYITLCGRQRNRSATNPKTQITCRNLFDASEMAFVPIPDEIDVPERSRQWLVVSTEESRNGKLVTFPTNPSRRAMKARYYLMMIQVKDFETWFYRAINKAHEERFGYGRIRMWVEDVDSPNTTRAAPAGAPPMASHSSNVAEGELESEERFDSKCSGARSGGRGGVVKSGLPRDGGRAKRSPKRCRGRGCSSTETTLCVNTATSNRRNWYCRNCRNRRDGGRNGGRGAGGGR